MKHLFCITLALCLLISHHAAAQENTYTDDDNALLQSCVDEVEAGAGEDEGRRSLSDCVGIASSVCQESDPTTVGISECNMREMSWWDDLLNENYASLKAGLAPDIFASLRQAQRAWIDFRDANCRYTYDLWGDGTIRQIVGSACWLDMTAERAIALSNDLETLGDF